MNIKKLMIGGRTKLEEKEEQGNRGWEIKQTRGEGKERDEEKERTRTGEGREGEVKENEKK